MSIRAALANGQIIVSPPVRSSDIRGVGLRIHLGRDLLVPAARGNEIVDLASPQDEDFEKVRMAPDGYVLDRGAFVLAHTQEEVATSKDICCMLDGRSS